MADAQGIHYSTPLQNFESVLVLLFDKGIQACQSVPQLEKVCIFYSYSYFIEFVQQTCMKTSSVSAGFG